jgi:outer membrane protein assembly factor BamB
MKPTFVALAIAFQLILLSAPGQCEDWLSWRGPRQDGIATAKNLPSSWSDQHGIVWKRPLPGTGYSSPIIIGNQVVLTSSQGIDFTDLSVISLDAETGALQWNLPLQGTKLPFLSQFAKELGTAVASCVSDGKCIVAAFSTGEVACMTLQGEPLWFRSLGVDYAAFTNDYGAASSPVIVEDKVIMAVDQDGSSYVVALDLGSGKSIWMKQRPKCGDNWATPLIYREPQGNRNCAVLSGTFELESIDVATGETLWVFTGAARLCAPTPFQYKDKLISTSGPGGQTLSLSLNTLQSTDRLAWKSAKGTGFLPSAIRVNDKYLHSGDRGVVTCLSLENGEEIFQKRIGGSYRASPVLADGKIYFTSLEGTVTVMDAESFEVLGVSEMGEKIGASPAVANDSLYFRGEKHLFRIGSK